MNDTPKKESKKPLLIFGLIGFLLLIATVIKIGFTLWFWIFLILWLVFFLIFWLRFISSFLYLIISFVVLCILTISLIFFSKDTPTNDSASTKNNTSKKSFSCPDNEVHSKKTSSGDTVYWRCDTAHNTKNIPYAQLSIQIADDVAGFPYNGKNSAASTSNDRRLYCMTYKTKNGKESSCSSFFDYNPSPSSSRPGCNGPEDCYNKDSTKGSTPWVMPFVPNSVTAVVYASGSDIADGIDDISQLIIYPFSISADGKSDQNESPKKYSPLKTIELK